ncbi:hypothetical protein [Streptomyces sp. NPDC060031]|uniref:hypothetical protein n=1 Tax=Streptomyces sp. NPDC060031 TaxID=3347043 RepID=UPI00369DB990
MSLLYDDFTTGAAGFSVSPLAIETHYQSGSVPGGVRSTTLRNALSPKGTPARLDVGGAGRLRLTLDAEQYARLEIAFGISPDGTVADLGLNLHEGGADRIRTTISHLDDTVVNFNISIGTSAGYSSAGKNAREGRVDFLFSEFAGPAGQDFTHVNFIVFVFTVRGSMALDGVELRHTPPAREAKFGDQIKSGGLAALGGSVELIIHDDGTSQWSGHAHDSGLDGYSYGVSGILSSSSGKVVAYSHHGEVSGTLSISGSRSDDWNESHPAQPLLTKYFSEFATGEFHASTAYASDIGSTLESAFSSITRFVVGGSGLGSVLGLAIFIGAEAGSLVETGSLVPGARIAEGVLWLAGPSNTLFALAAEGVASAGSRTRALTDEEYDWANREVFAGTLPAKENIVLTDTIGAEDRPFTFPRYDGKITLNMGPNGFRAPRRFQLPGGDERDGEVFIHELCHAWQCEHTPAEIEWLADSILSSIRPDAGNYGAAGPSYGDFNVEQQAHIVADWFSGRRGPAKDPSSPYFRYIQQNIRTGQY